MTYTYQWAEGIDEAIVRVDDNGNVALIEKGSPDYSRALAQNPRPPMPIQAKPPADPAEVRAKRRELLRGCDWTQLPDAPLTDAQKQEWATYRQKLRDLPTQANFPDEPDWPEVPQ